MIMTLPVDGIEQFAQQAGEGSGRDEYPDEEALELAEKIINPLSAATGFGTPP